MPAPTLNFVPHGPGWPGYRNPVTGQAWSPKTGYAQQGMAGMGEFFTMDQLAAAQAPGAAGAVAAPGYPGSFLDPTQLVPNSGPMYGPWDPNLATYGMAGMGAVDGQPQHGALKLGLAVAGGAALMYFFGDWLRDLFG